MADGTSKQSLFKTRVSAVPPEAAAQPHLKRIHENIAQSPRNERSARLGARGMKAKQKWHRRREQKPSARWMASRFLSGFWLVVSAILYAFTHMWTNTFPMLASPACACCRSVFAIVNDLHTFPNQRFAKMERKKWRSKSNRCTHSSETGVVSWVYVWIHSISIFVSVLTIDCDELTSERGMSHDIWNQRDSRKRTVSQMMRCEQQTHHFTLTSRPQVSPVNREIAFHASLYINCELISFCSPAVCADTPWGCSQPVSCIWNWNWTERSAWNAVYGSFH